MTGLPAVWALCEIGDVLEPVEKTGKHEEYRVIWYVDISSIDNKSNRIRAAKRMNLADAPSRARQKIRSGDVLFSTVRPYLRNIASVEQQFDGEIASTGFAVLRGAKGIEPGYLFYKSISHDFVSALTGEQYGVSYPAVKEDQVKAQPLELPPTPEQRRIVERIEVLFDEIDRGVESLRDAKRAIGLYRQSLLKAAFEGRLTTDWRAANPDKLESPDALLQYIREERETRHSIALEDWERSVAEWRKGGKNGRRPAKPKPPVRPEKCEVEGLRELPEGWFYLSFDALARSIRNGISVKPDEIGPLKIFRISAVRPMAFDLNDFRHITDPDGSMETYRLEYGDLVFTRYNGSRDYVGVSAMYRGDGTHVYPDKLIRCQIDSEIINAAYLEAATNCGESRSHVEGRIRTTAGQSGVSGNDIKTIPVPICSPAEQAEIVRILDARLEAAEALDKEVDASFARADALRQSILRKAFAGELVPQDPDDEPAQALLARIRASRGGDSTTRPRRRARRRASAMAPS